MYSHCHPHGLHMHTLSRCQYQVRTMPPARKLLVLHVRVGFWVLSFESTIIVKNPEPFTPGFTDSTMLSFGSYLLLLLVGLVGIPSASASCLQVSADSAREGLAWNAKLNANLEKSSGNGFNCTIDLTPRMPSCKQMTQSWCWATSISEMSYYYNKTSPATNCSAVECSVVGNDLGKDCCPVHSSPACDSHGASGIQEVASVATNFTGLQFTAVNRPLAEQELADKLMSGHPVIMAIHYPMGGGHVMVIGGCKPPPSKFSGKAQYFVHNPEEEGWDASDYNEVLNYGGASWFATAYTQ